MLWQQIANGMVVGSSYALMALGLTLIYGILGIPNFSHGQLYMAGAIISYILVKNLSCHFFLSVFLAMAGTALLGIAVNRIAFRPLRDASHLVILVATFAIGIILENGALLLWGSSSYTTPTPYAKGVLELGSISLSQARLVMFFSAIILILIMEVVIRRTTVGKAMRAVEQNRIGAAVVGININRVYGVTFAIGSALAAAAGALAGSIFTVETTMGNIPVVKAFIVIIIGGIGSVLGSIVAALIIGLIESLSAAYISSSFRDVFAFLALIIVLLFRPMGLFGRRL